MAKHMARKMSHYGSFKRELSKKLSAIKALVDSAIAYPNISDAEEDNVKKAVKTAVDRLEEDIIEQMGEILGD